MAFDLTVTNPLTNTSTTGYGYIGFMALDFDGQVGRLLIKTYLSKNDWLAGGKAIEARGFPLPKEGYPALNADKKELFKKPDNTYVLASEKDNPDAQAQTATYPEIPPFMQFIYSVVAPPGGLPAGTAIIDYIGLQLYLMLKTRPEFADATIVDIG